MYLPGSLSSLAADGMAILNFYRKLEPLVVTAIFAATCSQSTVFLIILESVLVFINVLVVHGDPRVGIVFGGGFYGFLVSGTEGLIVGSGPWNWVTS